MTGSNVACGIFCGCGYQELVEEPENGQTLGGTVGDKAARHEALCNTKCVNIKWGWI